MNSAQQQSAYKKLSRLKVGALFMEMGTGKTKVALDLVAHKSHKINYILWVCPYSLKSEIKSECQKWHPELNLDVVGVESIGMSDNIYINTLIKVKNHKSFVIVDESLKIKNKNAKRTKRLIEIGKYAQYKLILNGTPISKNCLDLWSQMEFLSPKILNMTYRQFKNTYTEYYLRGELRGVVKSQCNIDHLISLISPYIYDSKLDINPEKYEYNSYYSMTKKEIDSYELLKDEILSSFIYEDSRLDFYVLTTKLQKFYVNAQYKYELLDKKIHEINDKVIVFVKFVSSIPNDALAITGEMNTEKRNKVLKEFKESNDPIPLYITYGCGSYGLNLQYCHNMIFAEHTFDYAQKIQAEARIYRMGQSKDVNYYNLWCDVGLEDLIMKSLNKKTSLLDDVKKEIERDGLKKWLKNM